MQKRFHTVPDNSYKKHLPVIHAGRKIGGQWMRMGECEWADIRI